MGDEREASHGGAVAVLIILVAFAGALLLLCGGGGVWYIREIRVARELALEEALQAQTAARLAADQARAALEKADAEAPAPDTPDSQP
jgi:hypothetical protein